MDLKQLKEFIKKLVELDTQTNYSTTINQLRSSINNIKSQKNAQLQQPNVNVQTRNQQIQTYVESAKNSVKNALNSLNTIQNQFNDYKFSRNFNQLSLENPYGQTAVVLLNRVVSEMETNIDLLFTDFTNYHTKLTAYKQFINATDSVLEDLTEDGRKNNETDEIVLFFEGEADVENLRELSKVSIDWHQIINCFARLTKDNNTEIEIISIEKGSLIATLSVAAAIIGGLIKASDKIMDLILKIYAIRIKALELKKMQFDNIAEAIVILEKQAEIDLSEQSKKIVEDLMKEYGWKKSEELYNETNTAAIKAVKKMIRFHNSGGKVDSNLLNPTTEESNQIDKIRAKNKKLLSAEQEVKKLTGTSKILQINQGEKDDEIEIE